MTNPTYEYKFVVLCSVAETIMVFAYTRAAARLHKHDLEKIHPNYSFAIVPTRRLNGVYVVNVSDRQRAF